MYARDLEQRATCRREAEYRSTVAGRRMPTSALTPGYLALPVNIQRSQRYYYCGHMDNLPPKCSCNHTKEACAVAELSTIAATHAARVRPPRGCQDAQREAGTKVAIYLRTVVKPARPYCATSSHALAACLGYDEVGYNEWGRLAPACLRSSPLLLVCCCYGFTAG
jgi:hypothetical protein